jgi:hypothetical protein
MCASFVSRLAALAVVLSTVPAFASTSFTYTKGQPGNGTQYQRNDSGGTLEQLNTSYDPTSHRLTFDTLFTGSTSGGPLITSGFWLVLDGGTSPKGHSGELAIFYFDASTLSAPKITAYGYNGANASTSWQDGNIDASGNQTPDLIKGIYDTSWINTLRAENVTIGGTQYRHLSFDVDATDIIAHNPLYPVVGPWVGTGFGSQVGIWLHPVDVFTAAYESSGSNRHGKITSLTTQTEGWLDATNFNTVPAPASCALLGLGALCAARRRRA